MEEADKLVEVALYSKLSDLALARSLLESADIECFTANENLARIAGPFAGLAAVHGFSLQVRASDLHEAKLILQAEWPPLPPAEDADR